MTVTSLTQRSNSKLIDEKLLDLNVPGHEVVFDPDEAESLGAFEEKALSMEDAKESSIDLANSN